MKKIYCRFLRFYPADYQATFAYEMRRVFEEAAKERRAAGWSAYLGFAVSELAGLCSAICAEWVARFTVSKPQFACAAAPVTDMPHEVAEAQRRVNSHVQQMIQAIASHEFEKARFHSKEEQKAREVLHGVRAKYNVSEAV